MSYDLYLRDPVTREELEVPGHMMFGGNIPCDVINGRLVPTTSTRAYLNITYNYSKYYYDAFPSRADDQAQYEKDRTDFGVQSDEGGINSLNGLTGLQAVPLLEEMIRRIERVYRKPDGWVETERKEVWFENRENPKERKQPFEMFLDLLRLKKDGMADEQAAEYQDAHWEKHEETIVVNEGQTGDYWCPTAANAIRPLHQLIALSKMRPDGVWSEES